MIPDFLVIGRLVLDATNEGLLPGGAVFYAAHTALRLGWRTAVLTNARPDCDVAAALPGAMVRTVGRATTVFENRFTPQGRRQRVQGTGTPIAPDDIPHAWRATPVVLIGPVLDDVMAGVASVFPQSLVGIAPQGWMRRVDAAGKVMAAPWFAGDAVLPNVGAVMLSLEDLGGREEEARALASQTSLLVLTEGARGCRVFRDGREYAAPGFPARQRDPTGAGDVFAAAFLIRYAECGDPAVAAVFANAVAARSVEAVGVAGIPTRSEVTRLLVRCTR